MMYACISLLIGYIVGTINPAYIIGRIKGIDVRQKGSGNAGGSNALITMGKAVGAFCILFDILKAYLVVKLTGALFPSNAGLIFCCTGVGCIFGHMFPFYMRFKGGKGLACLGGIILAYDPVIAMIMLACEIAILFVTDYIVFVPITGSIAFVAIYAIRSGGIVEILLLSAMTLVMLYKHIENLKRIRNGTELRFSFLWKKDEALKDIGLDDPRK